MKPPDRIRIRLLGGFEIACDDGIASPIRLSTKKVCALVAFLAMNRKQAATREELATLLWGSCSDQQARQSLRQALVLLRKDLRSPNVLYADKEIIRLQPGSWSVDALEFEALADSSESDGQQRAVDLFSGEFLNGFSVEEEGFDDWLRAQRDRIRTAAGRVLATYAERTDAAGSGQQAIAAVQRLLALDPLREDWQRLALRLYARYCGQHDALAQAKAFEALLRRELDVEPEPETQALVETIRRGDIARAPTVTDGEPIVPSAGADRILSQSNPTDAQVGENIGQSSQSREAVPPSPWWHLRGQSGRSAIAGATVAALVLAGGIVGWKHIGPAPVGVHDQPETRSADAAHSTHDPWRSPRLPSRPAADELVGRERGLVAIAVLPFTSHGEPGEPAERPNMIADMMADDLTNLLSRVSEFRVISYQSASTYRGQRVDAATLGAELGIRYLLEGSVRVRGNQLGVSVELVDTKSRRRVWAGRFERAGTDQNAIEDEIVRSLGRELQIEVARVESEGGSKAPDVHELIFKGWAAINAARKSGLDALRPAEAYFTQALERDPDNTRAQHGLGAYHAHMAVQLFASDPAAHLAKAEAILQPLIDRHPNLSGPYTTMGLVHVARDEMNAAARSFERAIEFNPSHALSHAQLGRALVRLGRPQEGLEHVLYAMRLSPRDPGMAFWLAFAGSAQVELKQYDKAIDYLDRALSLNPGQPRTTLTLIAAHALAGNMSQASLTLEQLQKARPQLTRNKVLEMYGKDSEASQLRLGLRLALASPWDSPPLPSQRGVGASPGTGNGVVAIAVLPFTSYGEKEDSSTIVADMMTDDLTNILSRTATFRVISRQTARSYRGQRVDAAAVGAELGVRYLLEGSVSKRGDLLRVNVELVDTRSRLHVWSGRFERAAGDLLTIQDEIVNSLGRELQIEVTRLESYPGSNAPDVHELIFKGSAALSEAAKTGLAALRQAETYFTQALERDPDNPRAQAGLGAYHVLMAVQLFAPDPAPHLAKAQAILQQVIDRYPNMAGPYSHMGLLDIARGRREAAVQWFERSIELNPSHALAYAQLGRLMVGAGRPEEGLQHIHYAMRLSPRDPLLSYWLGFAGTAELELKRYEKAIAYLDRAVALHPSQPRTLLVLVAAHALAGNADEARRRLEQVQKTLPHLSGDKLIERFFGGGTSGLPQLREGLRLALASSWESPRLPSQPAADAAARSTRAIIPIVVLPFTTYGESAGSIELLADMMTDDLINMFSRVPSVRVISRQTSRSYKGRAIDVAAMGAELQVRYVLEGSMRMQGDKLRVNVELIDPATRLSVWSGRIERDGADRFGVQDEIVGRLARELQFELYSVESERRSNDPDASTLAYRGWAAMWAAFARSGADTFRQAETYFVQALERDPQNFSAQMGLGAYHVNVAAQLLVAEPRPHLDKARDILQDLIRRAPRNSGAHFYMGLAHQASGNLQEAIESFERAVEFNPSNASAHAHVGHALARMGRQAEGLEHLRYAMRLSPRDPNLAYWLEFAGSAELELNRYQQAIENFHRSSTLNPGYPRSVAGLIAAHALSDNIEEARVHIEKLKTLAPGVTAEGLIKRFGRRDGQAPRLREGLRLALAGST